MTAQEREQLLFNRMILVLRAKSKDDLEEALLFMFEAITQVAHTCPSDVDRIVSVDFRVVALEKKSQVRAALKDVRR